MDETTKQQPRTVQELERGGEIRARWSWVESTIWTDRMLEALETGVRGGKWHSLMDKVWKAETLKVAWMQVKSNDGGCGVDQQTIEQFEVGADNRLAKLSEELRSGKYKPQPIRRKYIPKTGSHELRALGIPVVTDRIVQTALRMVIEPIFEDMFEESSFGSRPGRGTQGALAEVERLLASGYMHVVDVDITKYFDTIRRERLIKQISAKIADGSVLSLIEAYLNQEVLEEGRLWTPAAGTPQGAVISPMLANLYLHPVDVAMREAGYAVVRYIDDMVVLCRTREEAEAALLKLRELLEARELSLHPTKTRITHLMEQPGFQFLGYVFYSRFRDPRASSEAKLRQGLKRKTKLTSGTSLREIIDSVNMTLRGFYQYFRYCSKNSHVWQRTDGWLRFRLRAILDKRRKRGRKRRRGRGIAQQRWPNAFFTEQGLFSFVQAPKLVRQP